VVPYGVEAASPAVGPAPPPRQAPDAPETTP
jgi:hypothetical protein